MDIITYPMKKVLKKYAFRVHSPFFIKPSTFRDKQDSCLNYSSRPFRFILPHSDKKYIDHVN